MSSRAASNQIKIYRHYRAPITSVWDAWTIPTQLEKWWGPRGFTLTTHQRELRDGGSWTFTMHGPDGVDYANFIRYLSVVPRSRLEYEHATTPEAKPLFHVDVRFNDVIAGTEMDITWTLASAEAAAEMAKFVKRAGGLGTWDRLAEHVEETATGRRIFVIQRSVPAPIHKVFEMWTDPTLLARWLPPTGSTMTFLRDELSPGKSALFKIEGPHGVMHVRTEYLEITPPKRIVYLQQFVDEREMPSAAPGAEQWPTTLRNEIELVEEPDGSTRITISSAPYGDASDAECDAFVQERGGMTLGWTGSLDALGLLVANGDTSEHPM